jgi:hypothetical protein
MSSVLNGVLWTVVPAVLIGPGQAVFAQTDGSQNFIDGGDETLTLDLGGILNQFDTSVRLDGQATSGNSINLEGSGGQKTLSSFEASATWRFFSRNRIDVLYFQAKRSGGQQLDRTVVIGDNVVPSGSNLAAQAQDQFLLADYRYSFVKTKQIEAAGLVGFYGGQYKYKLTVSENVAGNTQVINKSASTTAPLPVIGVTLDWYINPRWKISGNVEGLKAHVGDTDGSIFVAGAATEFMLVRNFGIGLAYMYSDVNVDVSKSDFNGNLTWKMNSVRAYGQFKF